MKAQCGCKTIYRVTKKDLQQARCGICGGVFMITKSKLRISGRTKFFFKMLSFLSLAVGYLSTMVYLVIKLPTPYNFIVFLLMFVIAWAGLNTGIYYKE